MTNRFRVIFWVSSFILVACARFAAAQTVFVGFTSAADYNNNFDYFNGTSQTVNSGGDPYVYNSTVGVEGGGGIQIAGVADFTTTLTTRSWNLSTNGAKALFSVLIYSDGQANTGDKAQFGFVNTTNNGLNDNAGVEFESFRFFPNSANNWSLFEQYLTGGVITQTPAFGTVNVTTGHWYKFVMGVTNTSGASGNITSGCALVDYGADGLTPGAVLITASDTLAGQSIGTNSAVWPALRIFQDAGVSAWDNFFAYTDNSSPVITEPLTNLNILADAPATFSALADGPGAVSYAWFTNGGLVSGAANPSLSVASMPPTLTNVTVLAANANGSVSNSSTIAYFTPSAPTITNVAASGITATSATLNADVLNTGGATPNVALFYGTTDGGENAAAWSSSVNLGAQSGFAAANILNLSSNTTYYFTAQASNSQGVAWASPSFSFRTLASNPVVNLVPVYTYHNDNTRWGLNSNETILTPSNVNTNSFGKLFSYTLDGFVYAEPLIVPNVNIAGKGFHDVVYVVTEHNSVYALDADSNQGGNAQPLWKTSFLGPNVTTVPSGDTGTGDIIPEVGITSTPVIDPSTGTLYCEVKTKENGTTYVHRLHALDITTGAERANFNSPFVIACTNYPGNGGGDNDGQGHVNWNPLREHSRPALTLLNGVIYISYASHGDNQPYHGWFFGYNATNFSLAPTVFNSTPNGGLGGFWDGGGGPSVDSQGNMYFQTGNGTFDGTATLSSASDYAMSVIKFSTSNGLSMVDYFAPSNAVSLSDGDQDLGSAAPMILPDSVGSVAHPHLVIGGGKSSPIYLMDRDNMGRFNGTGGADKIVQQFNGSAGGDRDASPAFFNNTIYTYDASGGIGAFSIANAQINTTPVNTPDSYNNKGGATACISANGTNNGIMWAIANAGGDPPTGPVILRAYNATNVSLELYTSDQLPSRDSAGDAVKFVTPTIANGKVYVGAQYSLTVYGLATNFVNAPNIAPDGGIFTNFVIVTLSDATPGASIYYTLDGTTPTTNSALYTGPFKLSTSASVTAAAFKTGSIPSGISAASFLNSSSIGTGTGLFGQYWANTSSGTFLTPGFNTAPTLTRVDPTINFNWDTTTPAANIGPDDYVVEWTGSVQPQFDDTFTFYTTTDDGVLLWVNGQLLVNEWVDQSPTTWSGSITLKAQQRYDVQMDYYQNGGGAIAQLFWSSPLLGPMTIIPESQLYPVTNPPPSVAIIAPTNHSSYTASASVTVTANAAAQFNSLSSVSFYVGATLIGAVSNAPYTLTATGLAAGSYDLTAVAVDGSGLASTSAAVAITVEAGSGQPYGLASVVPAPAFYNMPNTFNGSLPAQLSLTGVFSNPPAMAPAASLIPYAPNVPLWSDGAQKVRYFSVPNSGAPLTPGEQISYASAGVWSFPSGTVFVKTFELLTNQADPASLHRLETRLIVRDINGAVYGVTYKWRPDNTDADLLSSRLTEDIPITNTATGQGYIQHWYYPSPSDCLQCHTPVANYILGVNARQLNASIAYSNGVTDNELRALNHAGLFNPAIDEGQIPNIEKLSALTNLSASLQERARSYLDANCAQCHQPGGSGPTFDARYDTPLASQNIINTPAVKGTFGFDNVNIVTPDDIWRSSIYDRMDVVNPAIQMPPLARNLVDTNAVHVMTEWINSMGATQTLPPPSIAPAGGQFNGSVSVTLQDTNGAAIYYTLDGTTPTTGSLLYSGPFSLTNSVTVTANAWEANFIDSVINSAQFTVIPGDIFTGVIGFTNGSFQMSFAGPIGPGYVLQVSPDLIHWTSISTNTPASSPFVLSDPGASGQAERFYRVLQQ